MNSLAKALAGHQIEVQTYMPGLDFHEEDKDLIILSGGGGEGLEISDYQPTGELWHHTELEFVRKTRKPVLGICMGFEVIAHAHGAPITQVGRLIQGPTNIQVADSAQDLLGNRQLRQFEAHRWRVEDLPSNFEILATSESGIEMFRYKNFLATQFHPEKGGTLNLRQLLSF